jgi:hypothetical protein
VVTGESVFYCFSWWKYRRACMNNLTETILFY